ncbi:hypothetical protein KY285_006677 [Solanum tuberosum]|nr:hypothetical protein KY285_006677 [Solanum tuberosum]
MAGGKTTIMVLKVDLQCSSCYKKVKNILCKFPQIRDQVYDEKANTVTITVVCCNPEKLRDKLCSKGCGVIKSIEIKDPPKLKSLEKLKEHEKAKEVPKPKPDTPPPTPELVMPMSIQEYPQPPHRYCCGECYEGQTGGPCYQGYGRPVPPPLGHCCGECYEGQTGGPCYQEYGRPVPPPPGHCCGQCYEGQTGGPCYQGYGRSVPPPPCYDNYGPGPRSGPYVYGRGCYVSRCDQYFNDENANGCSIM